MVLSAILSVLGLGVLVYVLFSLAVHALPFFIAVTVGMYVYGAEAGAIVALVAAFFSGAVTLLVGQIAFATIRSVPVRIALGALYGLPAAIAGFHAVRGLSGIGGAPETWNIVFAAVGAVIVGGAAWMRVAALAGPGDGTPAEARAFGGNGIANDG